MELKDKIIVITGAASGIGKAMAIRFAAEGAKKVVCVDLNKEGAQAVADEIGGVAFGVNVGVEQEIADMIDAVENDIGPIDLFCSNAGILIAGGMEVPNEDWQRIWDINVMAHVWAARHLVPRMTERGGGYLLNTASAAGLLNQVGCAPYGVTKHAAVAVAEKKAAAKAQAKAQAKAKADADADAKDKASQRLGSTGSWSPPSPSPLWAAPRQQEQAQVRP